MTSKRKRKGRAKFIMIDGYVKRSAAWKALSPIERSAYLEVKWRYDGMNNGRIGLGCRELADEINMGRTTASKALDELQAKGFIVKAKPSAFHIKNRAVTEWRLTEYRCDVTGDLPSKDFTRWADEKKQQSAPADTQSVPADTYPLRTEENRSGSPFQRTVKLVLADQQSAPVDTYRYTMEGDVDAA
ncbi:hypothetical protein [Metarhizobium album]|uniref:hypothetical protein n=1 Tax=Metarhizobium album TaxID=2182425 RepID=UPI00197DB4E3|nr:hypothetical protein [Rhizobium album]